MYHRPMYHSLLKSCRNLAAVVSPLSKGISELCSFLDMIDRHWNVLKGNWKSLRCLRQQEKSPWEMPQYGSTDMQSLCAADKNRLMGTRTS